MRHRLAILIADGRIQSAIIQSKRGAKAVVEQVSTIPADVPRSLAMNGDTSEVGNAIVQGLHALNSSGAPATLIIPSGWCYTHVVDAPRRGFNRSAATFELEGHLPVELESLSCVFGRIDKHRVMGWALPTAPARTLLETLHDAGVNVERVVTDLSCVIAVGHGVASDAHGKPAVECHVLFDRHRCAVGITPASRAAPLVTRTLPNHPSDLSAHVDATVRSTGLDVGLSRRLDLGANSDVQRLMTVSSDPSLPDLADGNLVGRWRTQRVWGALTRPAAVLAVFLAALVVHQHVHRVQVADTLRALDAAMAQEYQRVFPDADVPAGPALRLASERLRLERLTRTESKNAKATDVINRDRLAPLSILRDWGALLPDDLRIHVVEASVDDHAVSLLGQTREHRDAERVSECLDRLASWSARPPHTSRLKSGGVEFSVRATAQPLSMDQAADLPEAN